MINMIQKVKYQFVPPTKGPSTRIDYFDANCLTIRKFIFT